MCGSLAACTTTWSTVDKKMKPSQHQNIAAQLCSKVIVYRIAHALPGGPQMVYRRKLEPFGHDPRERLDRGSSSRKSPTEPASCKPFSKVVGCWSPKLPKHVPRVSRKTLNPLSSLGQARFGMCVCVCVYWSIPFHRMFPYGPPTFFREASAASPAKQGCLFPSKAFVS